MSTCLSDRRARKYSVETSFRLMYRKVPGQQVFKIDVQGNARYMFRIECKEKCLECTSLR